MDILKKYIKRYRARYFGGFMLLLLTNAFALLVPWALKYAIDDLSELITYEKLITYSALIVLITLVQGIFRYLSRQSLLKVSHIIQFDILNDFFRHLLALQMSFYDRNRTGDLMSLATNDLKSVRMMLGVGVLNIMNTGIIMVFTFTILVMINLKLTLLALLPFPFIAIFVKKFSALLHNTYKGVQEEFAAMNTKVHENVSGIRVIKAYTRESDEIATFTTLSENYFKKNMRIVKLWGTILPLVEILAGAGTLVVLSVGGREVISGALTIGEFVAFNAYLAMLLWPMIALGWVLTLFQRSRASMDRINKIFDEKPEIVNITDNLKEFQNGDIEIKNLTFSYGRGDSPVLDNISLKIKKGENVAIVGPTGSGKTTLVNIIARLYKASDNTIFIGGEDINSIDTHKLRSAIGFVPQDTFLFSDTIKGNIAFGVEEVNNEKLEKYAGVSDILENVKEFPDNFDTYLGERGVNLSGGQKQRTTISRAIIKDPKIIILDDATSSVDTSTEENIISRMRESMSNCTLIMVSHRIATVMGFDKIIVVKNGRIEDIGTHEELIKKGGGTYFSMYERYLLFKELNLKEQA